MKTRFLLALTTALLASPAFAGTLIDNANGIQIAPDGKLQRFTGLVIANDGKVVRLLAAGEARPTQDIVIDAQGRTLLPGLIDAHGHVMGLGLGAIQLDLVGTASLQDLQQRLRSYAAAHPNDPWIVGRGWNQELWPDARFPTAADLDSIVPGRPVVLRRVDGHAVVANSAALKAAGITAATKDPTGGKIERDRQSVPTGLLIDAATDLVDKIIPAPTVAQQDEALANAQRILLGFGVTAAADMGTDFEGWETYRRAGEAGRLQVRIMSYALDVENMRKLAPNGPTDWLYGDRLRMVGVKLYADGALGSRGAWLKQPYADKPDTHGLRFLTDAVLRAKADEAAKAGIQVAVHAIGDAANAQAIGTYEWLNAKYGGDRRWRIEHVQVVDPADIPRIGKAGIIASMQPTHQTSDRLMAEKRLGLDRLAGAYAWQSMLKTGAKLAFGSDFPVESPNPFPGLAAAVSRQDMEGQPPGGWIPSQRLTFEQALTAFTRGAAYAGYAEAKVGALEPGKWADFILIDRDPTAVDPQQLGGTQVLETWVGGKKLWEKTPTALPERG
ncbi:MAG TPA: amidohydrolase [Sphingomicrobium sp.]|nr:amidohydrolase [Sphingomicrobium sp.]